MRSLTGEGRAATIDTQFYWKLTPHIFRYNHYYAHEGPPDGSIHAVDEGAQGVYQKLRIVSSAYICPLHEACEVQALVGMVRFFVGLILNTDESEDM